MSEDSLNLASSEEEERIARLFEAELQRPVLSEQALARIRATVENQWHQTTSQRWRNIRVAGIAASVVCVGLLAAFTWHDVANAAVVGSVSRIESGSLVRKSVGLFPERTLAVGMPVHAGEALEARGSVLLVLEGRDTLRIAPGTRIELQGLNQLELQAGQVYFDLPPQSKRTGHLRLKTPVGVVEHLGTQFEVATLDGEVRIRVREGTVQLHRGQGTEIATAGTELLASMQGAVHRATIATFGRQWLWVEALAPDYEIESVPLLDFVYHAAREAGLHVVFADAHARDLAARTRLHGSVSGLTPLESLTSVISATSLQYELHDDSIRVRSTT